MEEKIEALRRLEEIQEACEGTDEFKSFLNKFVQEKREEEGRDKIKSKE